MLVNDALALNWPHMRLNTQLSDLVKDLESDYAPGV